jgi:tellurite resistance protein TehA-like permease
MAEAPTLLADTPIPYGRFAFVMATGIMSIAAELSGLHRIAAALFLINLAAYPLLWWLLAVRLRGAPASFAADLFDPRRAPAFLTAVAATCVLGNQIALLGSVPRVAAGFWVAGALLWLGLVYCFFVAMTIATEKPGLDAAIDGSWLLLVVATEALAILTTHVAGALLPARPLMFAGLCLFLLGGAFYVGLLTMIVHRWLFHSMRPDQLTPAYWINMGAAAIATLAGTQLLAAADAAPLLTPLRGFVLASTILFWSLATWWIPLLAALTVWRHRPGAVRLGYRLDNWAIVFPLGMYTTASWHLAHRLDLGFLLAVPRFFFWVALLAWALTFAGMLRRAVQPHPARPAILPSASARRGGGRRGTR